MKLSPRAGCIAAFVFTILLAPSIYSAFSGRVPSDSGMLVAIFSSPTYFLLMPFHEILRALFAGWLHRPIDDRFAMEFDAITGWIIGCLQYGFLAAVMQGMWGPAQQNIRDDVKNRSD